MATPSNNQKPAKRRLRQSTETVREKATKAAQVPEVKAKRRNPFWEGFSWPVRQLVRGLAWLGKFRVFRLLARVLLLKYLRDSWRELRQVTWPSRRQSWQLTGAVIMFSIVFGAIIAGVDFGLDKLFKEIVLKK